MRWLALLAFLLAASCRGNCPSCFGDGIIQHRECRGSSNLPCPNCRNGCVECRRVHTVRCDGTACRGEGRYTCPKCEGTGRIAR